MDRRHAPPHELAAGADRLIVDAHHHIWDPASRQHAWLAGLPALNRAFGLADFERAREPERVTASVLVQVLASTEETEEFLALAAGPGPVAGVVGWTDLTSPAVGDEIARLRGLPGGNRLDRGPAPGQGEAPRG